MSKKKPLRAKQRQPKPTWKPSRDPRQPALSSTGGPSQSSKAHFSLQDEARFTGGNQSFWTIDAKLRNRAVRFVSAGLHSTIEKDQRSSSEPPMEKDVKTDNMIAFTLDYDHATETASLQAVSTNTQSEHPQVMEMSEAKVMSSPREPSLTSSLRDSDSFIIDTEGDKQATPVLQRPRIRSISSARSDSSDEVLFHGRSVQARTINDPVPNTSEAIKITENHNSWDNTSVEWVHRSKPGVGWSNAKMLTHARQPTQFLTFRIEKQQNISPSSIGKSAGDDYLENIQEYEPDLLLSSTFAHYDINTGLEDSDQVQREFQSLSVSGSNRAWNNRREMPIQTSSSYSGVEEMADAAGEKVSSGSEVRSSIGEESDKMSDGSSVDEQSEDRQDFSAYPTEDETLAMLLSKQEELGLGSDELFLFSEDVNGVPARAARTYDQENPKRTRRPKGTFPSAALMADVLEQDPYGRFEVMDFERPLLRRKKTKGRPNFPFVVSDELRQDIEHAWENDRSKKKMRRKEREEMRRQGLLGNSGVASKYGEGMTIWQIGKEFESFLGSELEEKSFPPMDKRRRKMVHEIAAEFNIKTKSVGSGDSRYTKLIRTKSTTRFVENRFVARARKINMGFFPRLDAQARVNRSSRPSASGANSSAVRYRDGDIVGGTAPEIGVKNKGRLLLEKMGWESGMALGSHDNKGILEPIMHVVKNTKIGLG
ncbi:uncharacterized protein PV09_07683 [Verruconis gallopava]|uniref:Protein SQS1 n=1 Tax=Verruconis gallopava TaxID=253628 RepID=A0A0D2AP97_9PEZI|nr:uncharacterized protein PV09_07683 [Verruconis gallopava]KIW00944.1 hypothetical protein PV09_07683 [Verruconis gallopava]